MKRTVLTLVLVLAALGLTTSPAMAAPGSQPAAPVLSTADFLASLAPAPEPMAKRPAIHGKALCFAQASCGDGTYVSCYGYSSTTSCSAADRDCDAGVQGHVKCDGVKTKCPVACPVIPPDCNQLEAQCAATCGTCPVTSFTCSPYSCRCGFNSSCA
jgi:hypothetical protein